MKVHINLNLNSIFNFLFALIAISFFNSCSSGIINYKDGSVYNGQYSTGDNGEKIRKGKGVLTYPSGKKYEGIWAENNLRSGKFLDEKGEKIYEGEWRDGEFSGAGKLTPKFGELSGYTLDGHFLKGKANGFGTLYKPDSTKEYEGFWKDFQYDGNGTFYLNGKKMYSGEFKNGQTDGKGIVYAQDGKIEGEGEFKNWKLNGYGKRYKNGKLYYEGYLSDNLPDGKGIMYYENGNKEYEGDFKKGNPHGTGISYKENGEKDFEGTFGDKFFGQNSNDRIFREPNTSKDRANVFYKPKYTLFDLLTDEPIFPNADGIYSIYYASNEERYPRKIECTGSQLSKLYFYKFKNLANCQKWCNQSNISAEKSSSTLLDRMYGKSNSTTNKNEEGNKFCFNDRYDSGNMFELRLIDGGIAKIVIKNGSGQIIRTGEGNWEGRNDGPGGNAPQIILRLSTGILRFTAIVGGYPSSINMLIDSKDNQWLKCQ